MSDLSWIGYEYEHICIPISISSELKIWNGEFFNPYLQTVFHLPSTDDNFNSMNFMENFQKSICNNHKMI